MIDDLPLFRWANAQPTATVVDLADFRSRSARWHLEIKPRETVEAALLAMDRCFGRVPSPAVVDLTYIRPSRRA